LGASGDIGALGLSTDAGRMPVEHLCSRLGIIYSLVIGVGAYMISSFCLTKIRDIIFR
jgi:hypothetical protein